MHIGIDLGTTNSVLAVSVGDSVNVVPIAEWRENPHLMPSVVDFTDSKKPKVFRDNHCEDGNLVRSVKRRMGNYEKIHGKDPADISGIILSEIAGNAEKYLDKKINNVVIGVPAHFDNLQRLSTKLAASVAGIKVLRLINEPTAAAIAYGLDQRKNGVFCVYDLGGGTFDFSVLRLQNSVFQVLAVSGDNNLGGDDVDYEIARLCCSRYGANIDMLPEDDQKKCIEAATELKEKKARSIYLVLSKFTAEFYITETELTEIIKKYADVTLSIADQAIRDARISKDKIERVVLVGGMTKSAELQSFIKQAFDCEVLCNINPDEAVAIGAALYAKSILSKNRNSLLIDVTPLGLGVETLGGGIDYVIARNSPIPFEKSVEYTTAEDGQTSISFNIVQGEGKFASQCRSLGRFDLKNIPSLPAGEARVIVTFKIDVNGILSVTARELTTGICQNIVVEPAEGLTEADFIRMINCK